MSSKVSGKDEENFNMEEERKKAIVGYLNLRNEADILLKRNLEKSLPVGRALKTYVIADMELKKLQMDK